MSHAGAPLFHVHLAATWYMVGLIWFVQLVHYPLFARVAPEAWCEYHRRHTGWTTWAVAPAMLVELITGAALLLVEPTPAPRVVLWTGLALIGVVWASTMFVQVPLHNALGRDCDPQRMRTLVRTNWVRTVAWTTRGVLLTGSIVT